MSNNFLGKQKAKQQQHLVQGWYSLAGSLVQGYFISYIFSDFNIYNILNLLSISKKL
jgi:hypothetical protein